MLLISIFSRPEKILAFFPAFRLIISLAAFFLFAAAPVHASGFQGPGATAEVTSAAQALTAVDDAPCVLEGNLVEKIPSRKNRYVFEDDTGKIVVEIKKKVFGDLTVTPRDRVRLEGEIDWSSKHPNEVEVEYLQIIP